MKSILKNFLFFALICAKNAGEGDILRQSTSIFYVRGSHRNHGNHRKLLFVTLNEITVNLYIHSALIDYGPLIIQRRLTFGLMKIDGQINSLHR